ncbi:ribonuclease T2 family protein [Tranquillimonas alkanivorans]|uniref:Ribonuclease T2 n=1 Tax=Tranquillimonas alkanivorans TaxID=441119 RepID=A0A1I5KT86_9RHOB|nr:ribonuclease T2 [Tranquillimonas alkanivorans]SFO87836.1 ribonuclease T2 [Tranquillimonas alkanivorans]
MRLLALLILWPWAVWAEGERAGAFDYYVLALSWSPTWCALEGHARGSPQCADEADNGWILHGLWPQYDRGWPSYCPTDAADPPRARTAEMADVMGTAGLAWYQWKKHGRCTGLSADAYFDTARSAYDSVRKPPVFRALDGPVRLPASVVEEGFLEVNPALTPDMLTITCREGRIQEARLCLTRDLEPRRCGEDVIRDCGMTDALMAPIP